MGQNCSFFLTVYPPVLMIQLHARNFWPLVWVWKPVQYCFTNCGIRRQWNFKSSITEAFASFLLLSLGKMLSISFDLLVPTRLSKHIIFAIIAIAVLIVFILLPLLLLLLYPLRCFHKCLDCCRIRYHALMVFTDAFQGAYKNGTNGTWDCRWFAVIYPSTRILWYITYALTLSSFSYVLITISLIGVVVLIIVVQPYENASHNKIDSLFMLTLAVYTTSLMSISLSVERQHTQSHTALILVGLSGTLPLLYLTVILLNWVYHCRVFASLCKMLLKGSGRCTYVVPEKDKADKEDLSQVNHYQIGWLTLMNTSCWKDHLEHWDNVKAANTEDLDCLSVTPPYELLG